MLESEWILRIPSPQVISVFLPSTREKVTVSTALIKEAQLMRRRDLERRVYNDQAQGFEMAKVTTEKYES